MELATENNKVVQYGHVTCIYCEETFACKDIEKHCLTKHQEKAHLCIFCGIYEMKRNKFDVRWLLESKGHFVACSKDALKKFKCNNGVVKIDDHTPQQLPMYRVVEKIKQEHADEIQGINSTIDMLRLENHMLRDSILIERQLSDEIRRKDEIIHAKDEIIHSKNNELILKDKIINSKINDLYLRDKNISNLRHLVRRLKNKPSSDLSFPRAKKTDDHPYLESNDVSNA